MKGVLAIVKKSKSTGATLDYYKLLNLKKTKMLKF